MNTTPPNPTRNVLLLLLALLALVALSGRPAFEVGAHFRQPEPEVRDNRFLALGRMAAELGVDVHMQANFTALPPLSESGSTLWLTVPGRMLSADDIVALQRWVDDGGRLVLAPLTPELWENDPLLAALGLELVQEDEEWLTAQLGDPESRPSVWRHGFQYAAGNDRAVRAAFDLDRGIAPLDPDDESGDPLLCDPVGCHAWRVHIGSGAVIALAEGWPFSNTALEHHEHAVIARLLVDARPGSRLDIVYGEQVPSLYELAWRHARFALFALPVAVLLWVLAAGQRFGPLLASPRPARRRLAEHVAAAGKLLARQGRHRALWQAVYDDFRRTLHRRHPQAHGMDDAQLAELIARHAGADPQQVRAALAPPPNDIDDAALARHVRHLDSLRRLL
ncbi:MAG: DUF4350 domain-containing protein [Gammaproteobacteria bacterium]